jgi:hypothetical protein
MTVEILYFPDCPNYLLTVEHVQKALQEEHVCAEIKHVPVLDSATARATQFLGSPSVRINSVDVEPSARSGGAPGRCCRTYGTGHGPEGTPSVALIREAIRELTDFEETNCCVQE